MGQKVAPTSDPRSPGALAGLMAKIAKSTSKAHASDTWSGRKGIVGPWSQDVC